jgi:hypothetical protein
MGKNFSTNNASGKRKKSDFYETPYSITWQLLEKEEFNGTILEPACGSGAILNTLKEKLSNTVIGYDLSAGTDFDFLKEKGEYDNVVTNPPFSLAMEFILKAKQVAKKKIAMLLPLSYLHGVDRYHKIYQDDVFSLSQVYVFTRYPMLGEELRTDGKYKTGMMVYAWYIWVNRKWDLGFCPEPKIRWIDNQEYVLKKGD